MNIRPAGPADAAALATIYGHHVLNGFGTFETEAPTAEDMAERIAAVQALGLPYLLAEAGCETLGFAYGAPFRPRASYRYTVEDSVYIAPSRMGQGVGKALLGEIIAACTAMGLRQMVAVIGDSANAGSIGLHRAMGFAPVGTFSAIGHKHGRWVDVVMMQRALNAGAATAPDAAGLALSGH